MDNPMIKRGTQSIVRLSAPPGRSWPSVVRVMKRSRTIIWCAGGLALVMLVAACGSDEVITPPVDNPPTIDLLTPNGGDAYASGEAVSITWTASDDGTFTVALSYTADGVSETSIATAETGTSFNWTVPNGPLYGMRVKAVATDDANQTAEDESNAIFAVVNTSARGYVTSAICEDCHQVKYDDVFASSHPYKIRKVEGGVAPTYPFSTVPNPPTGFTWGDITYVIGGYGWKARFMDVDGYIITDGWNGVNAQYNIPRADLGGGLPAEWTSYHASDTAPKPYNCGACHTTGWQTLADNGGVNQDGLVGIVGTWEEPGVWCEQCHDPGVDHVVSKSAADITVDESAAACGTCHTRDAANRVLVSGGYVRHHEQFDELLASGGMATLDCNDCHEPHIGTRYGHAAAGGIRAAASCESCHAGQTNSHVVVVDCETCHMPRATKSARAVNTFQGDVKTHIFKIKKDAVGKDDPTDGMWVTDPSDGKLVAAGFVTLDFVCYQCHTDPITLEGGGGSQKSLAELSARATGIHN